MPSLFESGAYTELARLLLPSVSTVVPASGKSVVANIPTPTALSTFILVVCSGKPFLTIPFKLFILAITVVNDPVKFTCECLYTLSTPDHPTITLGSAQTPRCLCLL